MPLPRVLAIAAVIATFGVLAPAQQRTPSTPEDRAKAVELAKALESDPLGPQAKEQRNWLIYWLIDVPDVSVKVCGNLVGPILTSKKNYAAELFSQMIPSAAAFIIEHPEKSKDEIEVYTAALEGVLRTYDSILKAKPKAKWPILDELKAKQQNGSLRAYVSEMAAHCK